MKPKRDPNIELRNRNLIVSVWTVALGVLWAVVIGTHQPIMIVFSVVASIECANYIYWNECRIAQLEEIIEGD
jgi:heme A synthase